MVGLALERRTLDIVTFPALLIDKDYRADSALYSAKRKGKNRVEVA